MTFLVSEDNAESVGEYGANALATMFQSYESKQNIKL